MEMKKYLITELIELTASEAVSVLKNSGRVFHRDGAEVCLIDGSLRFLSGGLLKLSADNLTGYVKKKEVTGIARKVHAPCSFLGCDVGSAGCAACEHYGGNLYDRDDYGGKLHDNDDCTTVTHIVCTREAFIKEEKIQDEPDERQSMFDELLKLSRCTHEFARQMEEKLYTKLLQDGWHGWDDADVIPTDELYMRLNSSDMIDVANYAMFIWLRENKEPEEN